MTALERLFVTHDDVMPADRVDVAIGVGIDVSADLRTASPYSRAIAQKAAALYYGGRVSHVLFTGGYPIGLFYVVKAFSEYGGGSQARLNHFLIVVACDTAAFNASKIMGHA